MLKITKVKPLTQDLVFNDEDSTIDRISGDSEVDRVKSKNIIIFNLLAKFKLLIDLSFETSFLTFVAR